jgi:hypothetical protein
MKTLSILSGALLMLAAVVRADTNTNPALIYYQAFNLEPRLSDSDQEFLFSNVWRGQTLPARFGELISNYDNEFRLVRLGAHSTAPCDWGNEWEAGPNTLLPQLRPARHVSEVLKLRVLWELQTGRTNDARDDLLASFTLAGNLAVKPYPLISALVQYAMEADICTALAENFGQLSPEVLQQLEAGIDAAPSPASVGNCISTEEAWTADWMIAHIQAEQQQNPASNAIDSIKYLFDGSTGQDPSNNIWPAVMTASGGSGNGVIALLQDLIPYYTQLGALDNATWAQYQAQLPQFSNQVQLSTNPFVTDWIPALFAARGREVRAAAIVAMTKAAIEYKLNGAPTLQSVIDPAGNGPFAMQRFIYQGLDRGFELTSAFDGSSFPWVLIFVESDGPPFTVMGKKAGQPATP